MANYYKIKVNFLCIKGLLEDSNSIMVKYIKSSDIIVKETYKGFREIKTNTFIEDKNAFVNGGFNFDSRKIYGGIIRELKENGAIYFTDTCYDAKVKIDNVETIKSYLASFSESNFNGALESSLNYKQQYKAKQLQTKKQDRKVKYLVFKSSIEKIIDEKKKNRQTNQRIKKLIKEESKK